VILTPDVFYRSLPKLIWHEDEPLWAPPSVALYLVSELASREVKVVLTGEGSDELFAGYDRYWMTALNVRWQTSYMKLPKGLRRLVRAQLSSPIWPTRLRRALGHTFLQYESFPDQLYFDNWFGVLSPIMLGDIADADLARELASVDVYGSHRAIFESTSGTDLIDRLLETDIRTNMVELLMKQDQMSMAASIESRVPFLDHKLVEFAATVPADQKIGRGSGKRLVKKALAGYLPNNILYRQKKGFPVPHEQWLKERFLDDVQALMMSDRAKSRRWLRPDKISGLFEMHRQGKQDLTRQIWALWGLELWARIFMDGEGPNVEPVPAS